MFMCIRHVWSVTDIYPIHSAYISCSIPFLVWVFSTKDIFHGQWRSIKGVAKQIRWLWSSILQILPVTNMNHGPFRSRMWRRSKEAFLDRWMSENTVESPSFLRALPFLAAETGYDQNSIEGRQAIFDSLGLTRTFRESGPVMKLMRWMSISDCWRWHRPDIEKHRFLLGELASHDRGLRADDVQQAQGHLHGENNEDDESRDSPEDLVSKMKALRASSPGNPPTPLPPHGFQVSRRHI